MATDKEKIRKFFKLRQFENENTYALLNKRLYLPKSLATELSCYCPGCGQPLKGTNPQVYFGDWFCGKCFEQYTGKKPK